MEHLVIFHLIALSLIDGFLIGEILKNKGLMKRVFNSDKALLVAASTCLLAIGFVFGRIVTSEEGDLVAKVLAAVIGAFVAFFLKYRADIQQDQKKFIADQKNRRNEIAKAERQKREGLISLLLFYKEDLVNGISGMKQLSNDANSVGGAEKIQALPRASWERISISQNDLALLRRIRNQNFEWRGQIYVEEVSMLSTRLKNQFDHMPLTFLNYLGTIQPPYTVKKLPGIQAFIKGFIESTEDTIGMLDYAIEELEKGEAGVRST